MAARFELGNHVLVDVTALGLPVGFVRTPDFNTLIPVNAQPLHGVEQLLVAFLAVAGSIGVLDPEHHGATGVPGIGPVEQRGTDQAHVRGARGRRAEAYADRGFVVDSGNGSSISHDGSQFSLPRQSPVSVEARYFGRLPRPSHVLRNRYR